MTLALHQIRRACALPLADVRAIRTALERADVTCAWDAEERPRTMLVEARE